jgi:hypothetical protein
VPHLHRQGNGVAQSLEVFSQPRREPRGEARVEEGAVLKREAQGLEAKLSDEGEIDEGAGVGDHERALHDGLLPERGASMAHERDARGENFLHGDGPIRDQEARIYDSEEWIHHQEEWIHHPEEWIYHPEERIHDQEDQIHDWEERIHDHEEWIHDPNGCLHDSEGRHHGSEERHCDAEITHSNRETGRSGTEEERRMSVAARLNVRQVNGNQDIVEVLP